MSATVPIMRRGKGTAVTMSESRLASLDWIRGIALLLVLLSHGWALWSTQRLESFPPLLRLVQSGNLGVTVFLVSAGFLLTRSMVGPAGVPLRWGTETDRARGVPWRLVLSRWARLSAQVIPLLIVVLIVSLVDPSEVLTLRQTTLSLLSIVTYTWNWYLQTSSPIARPDLGHLWYVAVYMQVTVFLVLLIHRLRHRGLLLVLVTAALLGASTAWRAHVVVSEGPYLALLRTTTRMDGMLWGALAALLWPLLVRAVSPRAATLLGLAGFSVLGVTMGNSMLYMSWAGVVANLSIVLFLAGSVGLRRGALQRLVTSPSVVWLGRYSLALYVWHYPLFFFVARRLPEAPAALKVAVAATALAALVWVTTRYVEEPIMRRLNASQGPRGQLDRQPASEARDASPAP